MSLSACTEANAVATVVESLALSRPGVGFSLRSEGRGALVLPAAACLRERISQVHGLALAPERDVGGAVPPEGEIAELVAIGQFAGRC